MSQISLLRERLRAAGAKPSHERRVLRLWVQALPQDSGRRHLDDFLPRQLRDALPGIMAEVGGLARTVSQHPGRDGSARLLVRLADGQACESVLLPRGGLCVSSQIGCAVGCRFCMTGREGLLRQIGSAEIVAQVALARGLRPVKKVVFMGMGEPAHNLANVKDAIEFLGTRCRATRRSRSGRSSRPRTPARPSRPSCASRRSGCARRWPIKWPAKP